MNAYSWRDIANSSACGNAPYESPLYVHSVYRPVYIISLYRDISPSGTNISECSAAYGTFWKKTVRLLSHGDTAACLLALLEASC